jgi:hypothetical protein
MENRLIESRMMRRELRKIDRESKTWIYSLGAAIVGASFVGLIMIMDLISIIR